jgi:hypothetical protein
MSVYRLLHFPALLKVKFHSKAFVLNYISSLFLIACHKTETVWKQQTDMNLLVTDSLYLLLAVRNSCKHAQRNTSAAVTL